MDVTAVCQRVKAIAAVRAAVAAGAADRVALEGGLRAVGEVRSWLAAAEAELAAAVADVVSSPEDVVARAGRGSQGEAARVLGRSVTLGSTPALAGALNAGATTPAHIDAVTKVAKGLEGSARDRLLARADGMVAAAGVESVRDFRSRLEREARRLRADDGMGVFQRQQAAVRVRRWTDGEGMWHLHGRFDPVTGVRLNARLQAEIEALFTDRVPEGCPTDPVERQEFLAALALASIMDGGGVAQRAGRPEFIVVIHADAAGETSETPRPGAGAGDGPAGDRGAGEGRSGDGLGVEWGLPVEVPLRVLAELFGHGDVHAVVVRGGVVLHAPGVLALGRTTRLANRAQRRALRALYSTCAIPGCETHFDRCKIHHVRWWRRGGRTDLRNLLPLCVHHHSKVHDAGWVLSLDADRNLTVRYPDGTVRATGPPGRRAA